VDALRCPRLGALGADGGIEQKPLGLAVTCLAAGGAPAVAQLRIDAARIVPGDLRLTGVSVMFAVTIASSYRVTDLLPRAINRRPIAPIVRLKESSSRSGGASSTAPLSVFLICSVRV
jgi:hypothetical protein